MNASFLDDVLEDEALFGASILGEALALVGTLCFFGFAAGICMFCTGSCCEALNAPLNWARLGRYCSGLGVALFGVAVALRWLGVGWGAVFLIMGVFSYGLSQLYMDVANGLMLQLYDYYGPAQVWRIPQLSQITGFKAYRVHRMSLLNVELVPVGKGEGEGGVIVVGNTDFRGFVRIRLPHQWTGVGAGAGAGDAAKRMPAKRTPVGAAAAASARGGGDGDADSSTDADADAERGEAGTRMRTAAGRVLTAEMVAALRKNEDLALRRRR